MILPCSCSLTVNRMSLKRFAQRETSVAQLCIASLDWVIYQPLGFIYNVFFNSVRVA